MEDKENKPTYGNLLEYLEGLMYNLDKEILKVKKKGWSCQFCLPSYEYYHCLYYIKRRINEKYLGVGGRGRGKRIIASGQEKQGDVTVNASGDVIKDGKKIGEIYGGNNFPYKECLACRFIPDDAERYEEFLNVDAVKAEDINALFDMQCGKLKQWLCEVFKLNEQQKDDVKVKNKAFSNEKSRKWLTDEFWKELLIRDT